MIELHRIAPGGSRVRAVSTAIEAADREDPLVLVPTERTAKRLRSRRSVDGGEPRIMTFAERSRRVLDRTGWTVPTGCVHGGRTIPEGGDPAVRARDWLAAFEDEHPRHGDRLRVVDRASDLVDVLEFLIADGIVPGPGGFDSGAGRRLRGSPEAFDRRLEAIAQRVPTVDGDAVRAAFEADRSERETFAREALASYLGWCLDRNRVSDRQIVAYAARRAPAGAGPVVVDAGPRPLAPVLRLAAVEVSRPTTVVTGASGGSRWAWNPTTETILDHFRTVAGLTDAEIDTTDEPIRYAPTGLIEAGDPDVALLDQVADVLDGNGDGIAVVAPTRATARRLMRLGTDRQLPLARSGRIEPFLTAPAVLGLAWLRVVAGRQADRGWAAALGHEGCSAGDIEAWLETDDKPAALAAFRSDLKRLGDGRAILAAVANRYGLDARSTAAVVGEIGADATATVSPTDAIAAIERGRRLARRTTLEDPPEADVPVLAGVDPDRPGPAVAIHRLEEFDPWDRGLAYAPPLGLRWRRTTVTYGNRPTIGTDPGWASLAALRDPPAVRAVDAARVSAGWARDRAILVGTAEDCAAVARMDLGG